jgi:hypothetical protein
MTRGTSLKNCIGPPRFHATQFLRATYLP